MIAVVRRILLVALALYGLTLLIACTPTPVTPPTEPVVRWKGRMDTLWTEPVDSVIKCDLYWKPGSLCWQVIDSVKVKP